MRLLILSELHLEFHDDRGEAFLRSLDPYSAEMLVLAGDICLGGMLPGVPRFLCDRFVREAYKGILEAGKDVPLLLAIGDGRHESRSPPESEVLSGILADGGDVEGCHELFVSTSGALLVLMELCLGRWLGEHGAAGYRREVPDSAIPPTFFYEAGDGHEGRKSDATYTRGGEQEPP